MYVPMGELMHTYVAVGFPNENFYYSAPIPAIPTFFGRDLVVLRFC